MLQALFTHEFTVSREIRTPDGQGGFRKSFTPIGTVRGRLSPVSTSSIAVTYQAGQESVTVTHVLYCPADADIRRGDQLTLDTLALKVHSVREPSLARHHLEALCEEVQQ